MKRVKKVCPPKSKDSKVFDFPYLQHKAEKMALENLILPNLIQYPWQTSPGATVTVGCEFVFLATSLD